MKLCTKCGEHPVMPYHHCWCRKCMNAYMRANRPKHRELNPEARKRANCRSYTNTLIGRGTLMRGLCQSCGTTENIQAHHADYSDPRTVEWLCTACHRAHHRNANRETSIESGPSLSHAARDADPTGPAAA